MTDLEERVERGCRVIVNHGYVCPDLRTDIEAVLRAAFPELFADPPSAWLAPWEATEAMLAVTCDQIWQHDFETDPARDVAVRIYPALRDAHLHSNRSGE